MRKHIMVVAFLLAVGIDASAQEFTGSIYGRIVDPTNASVPRPKFADIFPAGHPAWPALLLAQIR
jgi:hypothetical protein